MELNSAPMYQIAGLWKAGAAAPKGYARNALYWACVEALRKQGFVGDARRLLERVAAW
jgi:hypothetical protein